MARLLHLGGPDDLAVALPLVAAFHAETGIAQDDAGRRAAIAPLLDGLPHGALYLIGPRKAPVGYLVISFGWSVEFGGLDCILDEIYIRPSVRGRGIASEAISTLCGTLRDAGVCAIHLEVDSTDEDTARLYRRGGFTLRSGYKLMSQVLRGGHA